MTEALVIVGGSLSQLSLLTEAQSRGLATCVVDGRATAPLLQRADVGIAHDFSDAHGVAERIRDAGVEPIGVLTMGSDAAVVPTARLGEAFGLPGLPVDAALRCSDKRLMREAFAAHDVPLRFATGDAVGTLDELRRAYERHGPSIVVKPVDGSGQRGVSHVSDPDQLDAAFDVACRHSRSGNAIFETYLTGPEFTVSGFCFDGEYHPVVVTRRVLFPEPPLGVCRAHRFPNGLDEAEEQAAFVAAREATRAVGVTHGPSYVQLRMVDGEPSLIEVGARLGGGKDAELADLVVGINQIPAVVDSALGVFTPESLAARSGTRPCGQVVFFVREPGRVARLDATAARALPEVHEAGFYYAPGAQYPPFLDGSGRLGYFIVTADTTAELDARTAQVEAALEIEIEQVVDAAGVT